MHSVSKTLAKSFLPHLTYLSMFELELLDIGKRKEELK